MNNILDILDSDTVFEYVRSGLKVNPCNHELYLLLGDCYKRKNIKQAYLFYENALYHCINAGNDTDRSIIEQRIAGLDVISSKLVNNVSFVILTYNNLEYTKLCIESIRNTCFDRCYEIIVVDNASNDGSIEWLSDQSDIVLIKNSENRGFPAGCNQGIQAADPDNDIFLLNNDTIMLPNSLLGLRMGLYEDELTGATGAVTNLALNDQAVGEMYTSTEECIQFGAEINIPDIDPYEEKLFLVMFAMLIKRECLDAVGLLDERFTPGMFEDNDYGLRIAEKGYKCVLCHNSYIYHYGSRSFGADVKNHYNTFLINREKFRNKWGFYFDQLQDLK